MDAENEQQSKANIFDTDKAVLPSCSESVGHLGGPDTEIQKAKVGINKTQSKPDLFEKPERVGIDRYFELFLTCAIVYLAWSQVQIAKASSESSTTQLGQIIVAAGRINDAANSFSKSAADMSRGVSDAVDNLSSSVQQAKRLADGTEKSLHIDERAYISLVGIGDVPKVNEPSFPTAILRNSGKTNALRVRGEMFGYFSDQPDREERVNRKILRSRQDETAGEEVESPGIPFEVGGPRYPPDDVPPMPREARNLIMSGERSEVVYGRVDYYDIFGVEHWFTFCQYTVPNGKWSGCQKYNDADQKLE
jgi:hypothetical protein